VVAFAGGEDRSAKGEAVDFTFDPDLAAVPQTFQTSNGMRIRTQLNLEGMRSRVALKDLATSLGFGFTGSLREKITLWREKLEIRN